MNDNFKHIVDLPSQIVDSIISKAMFHSRKEDACRFLKLMDTFLCYYLNRECDELCFPIIRIPSCPFWAREVFLKYLILRLSIFYNQDSLSNLKPKNVLHLQYVDPDDKVHAREARRQNSYLRKWNRYKNEIKSLNQMQKYLGKNGHKNLIFCSPTDLIVSREDKNEFISEFYGEINDIFTKKNLCVCHDLTCKDIRLKIKNANHDIYIDNIFVFFTNNKECKSLRKANIEKLNRCRGVNIRNCFIFDFTDHPYRLAETLNRDKKLSFIYPGLSEKDYQNNDYFTCLTDEETRYIFCPKIEDVGISQHWHARDDNQWHNNFFVPLIGNITDTADYWVQERNIFSLCLSDTLTNSYKQRLNAFTTDLDENVFDESFEVQKDYAKKIKEEIINRVKSEKNISDIALIVDFYTPSNVKKELKNLLEPYRVNVYGYNHLRPMRNGKKLGNKIKEKYVFVLRYRPHNAKSIFSKYPNSFDPFTTNPGQHIIEIIQDYIFIDKYQWDKYEYDLEQYKFLNSEFRRQLIGGFVKPQKPDLDEFPRVSGDEDPYEERPNTRQSTVTMDIEYDMGRTSRIAESEWVIYRTEEDYMDINRLKNLKEDGTINQIIAIQRLDEITNKLSETIIEREQEGAELERITRNAYYTQGIITLDERDSDTFLWKILLQKKVEQKQQMQVYEEIMAALKPYKITYDTFLRWIDKDYTMILPLQNAIQERLMNYLGLSRAYLLVMRAKKSLEKNTTRKNNNMLERFLADYLIQEIDEDAFEEFKTSKINEILRYESIDDLITLVEILSEIINLKKVKSITV